MKQPVVKVGESLAVLLPADVVQNWKLRAGGEIELATHPDRTSVTVSEPTRLLNNGRVTGDFIRLAEGILEQFEEAWKRLA